MKHFCTLTLALAFVTLASGQQFMSRNAQASFFSSTPIEDISASTDQASAVLDLASNRLAFQIPIISFHFEIALMEEHFNENYMESEKFPSATFQGNLDGLLPDAEIGSVQNVSATGDLTIHGVSTPRTIEGTATRMESGWKLNAQFEVKTADHEIPIPKVVQNKIAESISVTVDAILNPR